MLKYKIDPQQSEVMIYTTNSGFLASAGHKLQIKAEDIKGSIKADPKNIRQAHLELEIKSASLKVNNPTPEKDKKEIEETLCNKVLECEQYPEIQFNSSSLELLEGSRYKISGELNLHGVRHNLSTEVVIEESSTLISAKGEFKIKQSDYQIKPPTALGGALKVKDELRISFDIKAPVSH